jgi:hypothetical protein
MSLIFNGHMAIFFLSYVTEQRGPICMKFEGENSEILADVLSGRSTGVGQILCTTVERVQWVLDNDGDYFRQ